MPRPSLARAGIPPALKTALREEDERGGREREREGDESGIESGGG